MNSQPDNNEDDAVWLDAVYGAANDEQLTDGYDGWARDYDRDLGRFGYRLPALAAGMAGRHIPRTATPVLDAGCGTGLLGEALHPLAFSPIDGLDMSKEMLAVARTKGIYRTLLPARLGDPLDIPDATYEAITCIGTFTVGHAGPEGFDELIRILKPGGMFVVSIRSDIDPDNPHRDRINELVADGVWEIVESSGEIVSMPWEDESVRNTVLALKKTPQPASS